MSYGKFDKKPEVFVLRKDMTASKAWKSLTKSATDLYLHFLSKRIIVKEGKKGHERWCITNKNNIIFTYNEAYTKYNISNDTFKRSIDNLIKNGFIDIVKVGNALNKLSTIYGISDRWEKYDTPEFKDIRRKIRSISIGYAQVKKKK